MRPEPFRRGARYRVKRTVKGYPEGELREGEILRYVRDGYIPYDSTTGYLFEDDAGRPRTWGLHDDEDLVSWRQTFEVLE